MKLVCRASTLLLLITTILLCAQVILSDQYVTDTPWNSRKLQSAGEKITVTRAVDVCGGRCPFGCIAGRICRQPPKV